VTKHRHTLNWEAKYLWGHKQCGFGACSVHSLIQTRLWWLL